jgi:hypothetical protein
VKIGMQHGISDASTLGFALLGFIRAGFENLDGRLSGFSA